MHRKLMLLALALPLLAGCGRDALKEGEAEISGAWAELRGHYRERAEQLPMLMSLVKAHAGGRGHALAAAGDALAQAGRLQARDDLPDDPAGLAAFQRAQRDLGMAAARLLAMAEGNEAVRNDPAFEPLRLRLEGTGQAIVVARNRYVRAVRDYNLARETMPAQLTARVLGYGAKANFTLENERDPRSPLPAAGAEGRPQGKVVQPPTLIPAPPAGR